jgi:hypothetical protein
MPWLYGTNEIFYELRIEIQVHISGSTWPLLDKITKSWGIVIISQGEVKLARFRKPKAICFFSYVAYRPNTNISNTIKKKKRKKEKGHTLKGGH